MKTTFYLVKTVADLSSLINLFLLKQSKRTDLVGYVG